jgi:tryptophanyl-tRNA synthetase
MAADIIIQDANIVPVGQDQKQHVEFARDTVEKFNRIFGETFVMPEPLILDNVAVVLGTDGQKMSKSYNNTIPLFATDEEIQKAVMSIVTDSSGGIPKNVYAIHSLFRTQDELDQIYSENEGRYKVLKDLLIEDIKNFIRPLREKRAELEKNLPEVLKMLKENGEKIRAIAEEKMKEVREKVGVSLY